MDQTPDRETIPALAFNFGIESGDAAESEDNRRKSTGRSNSRNSQAMEWLSLSWNQVAEQHCFLDHEIQIEAQILDLIISGDP